MNNDVEKIKDLLNIVDVIGEYVVLQKAGKNMRGLSPFTNEKSPSFFVSPDRQLFHCFSSGKGGDMFSFVQEVEGVDFRGSLKILADKAGITLSNTRGSSEKFDRLYALLDDATTFYEKQLRQNSGAMEYLKSRGLTEETIREWRIGYAPDEWQAVHDALKKYKDEEIFKVGLIKLSEKKRYYDTFRGRIMFPIFDTSGRVIAYSGRILAKDTDAPKYVNSPETPLFNKSEVLYGLDKAKTAIRRQDYAVLVEGQMDVVMSHQAGLKNTVASSGTALTELQLTRIRRYSHRLIVAFDSDRAGFAASAKNAEMGMRNGFDVKVAPLPQDADPADMIKEDPEKYREVLASSQHIVDFYVDKVMEEESDSRVVARRIRAEVLPLIVNVESSIEKAYFVQRIAERASLPEEAVWDDFKSLDHAPSSVTVPKAPNVIQMSRKDSILKELYGVMLWQKEAKEKTLDVDALEKQVKEIVGEDVYTTTAEELKGMHEELVFEAETKYSDIDMLDALVADLTMSLEIEYVRDQFTNTMKALALAEKGGDAERTSTLLARCQELTKQLAKYNSDL